MIFVMSFNFERRFGILELGMKKKGVELLNEQERRSVLYRREDKC
jgi:hypothetical protein